jgi:hypothetical protein
MLVPQPYFPQKKHWFRKDSPDSIDNVLDLPEIVEPAGDLGPVLHGTSTTQTTAGGTRPELELIV